jgi:hypothetical protein
MDGHGVGEDIGKNLGHNLGRLADSGSNYLIRQMDGHGVGKDIDKKLAEDHHLIQQMNGQGLPETLLLHAMGYGLPEEIENIKKRVKGGKVGKNLAKNLGHNLGRLADSGSDYLIRQMEGHGSPAIITGKTYNMKAKGGKVGNNLASNLGNNLGRLADSGTNYLMRQMDGHGLPEEIENAKRRLRGGEVGDGCGGSFLASNSRGRGFKKGSAEAKAHMAKIRGMRGKSKGGEIPQPPSRSPVTRGGRVRSAPPGTSGMAHTY